MLAAIKASFALKLATAAVATAAVAGVADATDTISLDRLFSGFGSGSAAVETGADSNVDGGVRGGIDTADTSVTGDLEIGVGAE